MVIVGLRDRLRTVPERHTERELLAYVPGRGHERYSWKEGSLHRPDNESGNSEAGGILDQGKHDGW